MELRENERKMKENQQITHAAEATVFLCVQLQDDPKLLQYIYGWIGDFPIFPKRPNSLNLDFK